MRQGEVFLEIVGLFPDLEDLDVARVGDTDAENVFDVAWFLVCRCHHQRGGGTQPRHISRVDVDRSSNNKHEATLVGSGRLDLGGDTVPEFRRGREQARLSVAGKVR